VYRRAYSASDEDWEELGVTPLENIRIPFGLSRIRIELDGYEPLERMLGGGVLVTTRLSITDPADQALGFFIAPEPFQLDTDATLPPGKVRVPGWTQADLKSSKSKLARPKGETSNSSQVEHLFAALAQWAEILGCRATLDHDRYFPIIPSSAD